MNPVLDRIRIALQGTPFEDQVWLVGGAVRDRLLGRPTGDDLDLTTTQSGPELAQHLYRLGLATHPPVLFERFGTAMLTIGGTQVEIATTRKDSYDGLTRKPVVERGTVAEDAARRDFTINALFQPLSNGPILDPTGLGLADLKAKILRSPLEPKATFRDDPLRMLRAVRFRWKLGFAYAEGLDQAIRDSVTFLPIISIERIRDEVLKMLAHPTAADALDDLMQLGILPIVAPELVPMVDCTQGRYHDKDVWRHTLQVVRNLAGEPIHVILAGLLHDVGKPVTRQLDANGDIRFFGHEAVGADLTVRFLRRWKFPESEIEQVRMLVKNHMRLGSAQPFTDTAARRLLRDLGDLTDPLFTLVRADQNALRAGIDVFDVDTVQAIVAKVRDKTPASKLQCPLTGEEIMALTGLGPGHEVGKIKAQLLELVLSGEIGPDDRTAALAWLKSR
ncbi:MAG: CCA tRNA nucleotidyltransferase [Fimbriimonas sp.]